MRYSMILLWLSSVLLCFTSCDDFLDTESDSIFTEEASFSNLDFAQNVLFGAYNSMADSYLYGGYFLWFNCDNDIEFSNYVDNGSTVNLAHYNANDGIAHLDRWWTTLYTAIETTNLCVDNLPVSPIWDGDQSAEARRLYGEAVTLRALFYSELIKIYGDVPFSVRSTQADDDFYLPKMERDSIYEYLVADLKRVEDYVPWLSESLQPMRVNKALTKGLRARIALAYAGYSLRNVTFETRRGRYSEEFYKIARDECLEIIQSGQHQLNPDFANIFKILHAYDHDMNYKEVFFEVGMGRGKSGRIANDIGMNFGYNDPAIKYGRSSASLMTSLHYFYSFDTTDIRRNVSVELYQYGTTNHINEQWLVDIRTPRPTKWRKSWIVPPMGGNLKAISFTGVNWPIMRYADVLLMFAEAENHLNGPTEEAKQALISVRKRAFPESEHDKRVVAYVDSVSASKEMFFNAIVDERAWEFGGEMLRKGDLVRWNLLGEKIDQMKDEFRKILDDEPEYQWIPNYLFWKTESDGETINILNPHTRLPKTPVPDGYTGTAWMSGLYDGAKANFWTRMNTVAHGFDRTKNNHLHPIHINMITSSNGVLKNDQIP